MSDTPIDVLLMQPELRAGRDRQHKEYRFHNWSPKMTFSDLRDTIRAVVTDGASGVPSDVINALPNLEIIAVNGVGFDQIDLDLCRDRGISVTTAKDVLSADVADLAMSLTLSVLRRVVEADRFIRSGSWTDAANFPLATSLTGKRMGIVGMGRIGAAIARRAVAFDMQVSYHNRRTIAQSAYQYHATLLDIANWSDILMLCLPGGAATRHVVDCDVLKALGPHGYLINVARGSVVDEDALVVALQQKKIAGAGLDVFTDEPNVPSALLSLDNVVLQPHIASATVETRSEMAKLVYRNLDAHFSKQALLTPLVF